MRTQLWDTLYHVIFFLGRKIISTSCRRKILDKTPFFAHYWPYYPLVWLPPLSLTYVINWLLPCIMQMQLAKLRPRPGCAAQRRLGASPLHPVRHHDSTTTGPSLQGCGWSLYYYYMSACKVNTVNKLINTLWLRWSEVGIVGNWKLRFISVLLIIPKPKQSINTSKVKLETSTLGHER